MRRARALYVAAGASFLMLLLGLAAWLGSMGSPEVASGAAYGGAPALAPPAASAHEQVDVKGSVEASEAERSTKSTAPVARSEAAGEKAISPASPKVEELFVQFKETVKKGDWPRAYELMQQAYGLQQTYDVRGNLGTAELQLGKYRDAAEHLGLRAGNGGNGAAGGAGQPGGNGGKGGLAGDKNNDSMALACNGGNGGKGGDGGPGGGGRGGPSLGVAYQGKIPSQTNVTFVIGTGGSGGPGGGMTMVMTAQGAAGLACKHLSFDEGESSCVP